MPIRRRIDQRTHRLAVKGQLSGLAFMAGKEPEPYGAHIPNRRLPRAPSVIRPERLVLRDILKYLRSHPRVAFVIRMQSGLFQMDDRPIRVGTVGMPDIVGMLNGGQFFAIEVKSEVGQLTESQARWLTTINLYDGRAGVARSVDDAERIIS